MSLVLVVRPGARSSALAPIVAMLEAPTSLLAPSDAGAPSIASLLLVAMPGALVASLLLVLAAMPEAPSSLFVASSDARSPDARPGAPTSKDASGRCQEPLVAS